MKLYIVYAHVNKLNGKTYIGQTCQSPERRWRNGDGYKHNLYFRRAIDKYGWDNFIHLYYIVICLRKKQTIMEPY